MFRLVKTYWFNLALRMLKTTGARAFSLTDEEGAIVLSRDGNLNLVLPNQVSEHTICATLMLAALKWIGEDPTGRTDLRGGILLATEGRPSSEVGLQFIEMMNELYEKRHGGASTPSAPNTPENPENIDPWGVAS